MIVEAILNKGNWRWGRYGMFAIIMPFSITPALLCLLYLDNLAEKLADSSTTTNLTTSNLKISKNHSFKKLSRKELSVFIWQQILEVDLFGLILMGFGWSLLLLPFSLYSNADNQWGNPSLISMLIIGTICLILYTIYEFWFAPFPSMPKRVLLNRTFMTAVTIDFFYQCGGMIRLLYF